MNTLFTVLGIIILWLGYGIPIASVIDGCIKKRFRIRQNADWTYSGYMLTIRFYGWTWRKLEMTDSYHEIAVDNGKYAGYRKVLELIHEHYGKEVKVNIMTCKSRNMASR